MDNATKNLVKEWLHVRNGDIESLARWMRDTLRIGSLKACRELIKQAQQ